MAKPIHDESVIYTKTMNKQAVPLSADAPPITAHHGFQTFTEQSPNMIFINKGGQVVYVNKRCIEVMG